MRRALVFLAAAGCLVAPLAIQAQQPPQGPVVVSPDVQSDRRVTFRILAPNAQKVELRTPGDIPGIGGRGGTPLPFTKSAEGVWEATTAAVPAGAYRYTFAVDGVTVADSRNTQTSQTNTTVYSLAVVPGSDVFDTKNVPHGAVAAVTYWSASLGVFRRMHVYTPPGYERDGGKYPVFYLLHGAGDNDHAWSSMGRAGFILDNLIAAGKARPMVVVMPAGHTPRPTGSVVGTNATQDFVGDFVKDVMPYVESHYRVRTDRANTAIAGLSMGGQQTLAVAIPRLERFAYIGVFSSGLIGAFPELSRGGRGDASPAPAPAPSAAAPPSGRGAQGRPTAAEWEQAHATMLADARLKKELKLVWFATGKDDFLLPTTRATLELLK
jgi:enterochelin esterase family protein